MHNVLALNKPYSTQQVGEMVGVHWTSLHRWLRSGVVQPSIVVPMMDALSGGGRVLTYNGFANTNKQTTAKAGPVPV